MTARPFVVISNARNGSNQLVHYISQVPGCVCLGEVFKERFPDEAGWEAVAGRLADPSGARSLQRDDLPGFWTQLTASYGGDTRWIGAKIFYEHRLGNPIWERLLDPAMPAIHLWRARVCDAFLSLLLAERTGEWMATLNAPIRAAAPDRIHFPVRRYLDYRSAVQDKFRMINQRIAGHASVLHIEYAEISRPAELSGRLGTFFGAQASLKVTLRKQTTTPAQDLVDNPEDLAPFLDDRIDQEFKA